MAEHKNSVYKKISEEIAGKIRSGEYPEGSRLEPERKLMELYGVERMTVRRALDVLAKQGLIVKKTGLGSFVSDKSMRDNLSDSGEKSADFRDNNDSSPEPGKTKNSQPALNKTKNQTQEKREKPKSQVYRNFLIYLFLKMTALKEQGFFASIWQVLDTKKSLLSDAYLNFSRLLPEKG